MVRLLLLYVGIFALGFVFYPSAAQAVDSPPPVFFSTIPDLPIMQGVHELPDHAVMFDKPAGRIIESVAQVDSVTWPQIQSYYKAALPQLGWALLSEDIYTRGGEVLRLEFEEIEGEYFLRIVLAPR